MRDKNWTGQLIFIMGGILLLLSGCNLIPKEQEALAPPLIEPAATQYDIEVIERNDLIDAYEGSAVFHSANSTEVYTRELGHRIKEIHVEPNQNVEKGQLLIELEQDDLEFEVTQQQIALNEAKLDVDSANERKKEQQTLRANIEKKKNKLKEINDDIKEQEALLKKLENEEEQQKQQDKIAKLDQKKQQQQQDIEMTEQQLVNMADLNRDVTRAQLNVERQQNQLTNFQTKLEATKITAPMSGRITSLTELKAGDIVEPFDSLATLSDPQSLRLVATPVGNRVDDLTVGMEVLIDLDGKELLGKVVDLPDENNPDKDIGIEVEDLPASIDLGERAKIQIVFEIRENAITIPTSAIRNYDEQQVVRILDGENLTEVGIKTGLEVGDRVEVISGLNEGDQLILR
ncbi:macrolide-specific efflux system membrane fusion protein [Gracilibacillus halotolerans]|uniref:Macrolide-specific efflux system membrane fusion protein n=1 Tax=Gracilibacillus halotolerans TaxID=74386 RepID=A0A841RRS4_9BACI|nr:HlyD family efflux transporter periplasmic adaptor subunit [Gracilibacillus halotolerans]MBB6514343.1 macrolide-specific efflux system membrane fusion protein [Gracilibacillus halotolerans]